MKTLLIVEDLPDVGRAYLRSFRRYAVDEVVLVTTPEDAEIQLRRGTGSTCLLCDHWLGANLPTGVELIHRWKASYAHLAKAVLVTGSDAAVGHDAPGVDAVFEKPPDVDAIASFLGLERRTP